MSPFSIAIKQQCPPFRLPLFDWDQFDSPDALRCYAGTARTLRLLADGTVFSARAQQKIRSGDRGWRYSAELLERAGADTAPEDLEARRAWYRAWTPRLTRTMRHAGNHRYAWGLHKRVVPVGTRADYPKRQAA